jgi:hypothetical protein
MTFCPNCGKEIKPGATRCIQCGNPIFKPPEENKKYPKRYQTGLIIMSLGWIILVIGHFIDFGSFVSRLGLVLGIIMLGGGSLIMMLYR